MQMALVQVLLISLLILHQLNPVKKTFLFIRWFLGYRKGLKDKKSC